MNVENKSKEKEKILEVRDLTVTFHTYAGNVQAVRGVSFDLYKGETLAIVGESGSGKSVSVKSLMGLLGKTAHIEKGTAMYQGRNLLELNEKEWEKVRAREIAMIFQDPLSSLNPIKKIGKQISEIFTVLYKEPKKEAEKKALELMRAVGIPEPEKRYNQYPFHFSGGMRQRIVIAIALSANPDILICDEPTTALDVTIQAQILELINRLKRERNLSIIFITHDLGVVANMADRIAVMYAGKIVEYGTAEEVFYNPQHPYTWALLSSMPDLDTNEKLDAIPGTPPNMIYPPVGDAFAERNKYALEIDYEMQPPMFEVSPTHYAATWLLHPNAPKVEVPKIITERIKRMKERGGNYGEQ